MSGVSRWAGSYSRCYLNLGEDEYWQYMLIVGL